MIHFDRLLKLADYLETVRDERFSIQHWSQETSCGTTCCAVGHACSIPEFRELGLGLDICLDGRAGQLHRFGVPVYQWRRSYDAVSQFFGLSGAAALFLFSPEAYEINPAKEEVISRIREFVRSEMLAHDYSEPAEYDTPVFVEARN